MDENSQADITAHAMPQISPWLAKLGCLIVGPGLGDDPAVVATTRAIIKAARQLELPLIVDGSAINVVAPEPDLVRGYSQCVLTPNLPEFGRLAAGVCVLLEGSIGPQWQRQTAELAAGERN
jgi:ATP-dependent NAD(P)H-hydrate dehydratase